jgi:uncharacterized membrane protein
MGILMTGSKTLEPKVDDRGYNSFAGSSVERIAAISDGVFAVAMTLLVLDIHAPAVETIHNEHDLWHGLAHLAPHLVAWLMSFMTLGIFWVGQQTQLNHLARSNRDLTWIHLGFLLAVSMTPFSTTLLAQFSIYQAALLLYWANIFLLGALLYWSWVCALGSGLVKPDMPPHVSAGIKRRIIIAQALYACGILLSFVNTRWSIAAIILVQTNYALALHLPRARRRA